MVNIDEVAKGACTGCGACESACPVGCVSFREDWEGFLAPTIDSDKCIKCRKCLRSCPASMPLDLAFPRDAELFRSLDAGSGASSSGGAAYAIGKYVIEQGGVVVSCAFDEQGYAKHVAVDTVENLGRLQGSKYVQSDARDGYRAVGASLRTGHTVLYIGTPCQAAAAKAMYGGDENLIVCDIVCHGVPSPGFWKRALDWNNERGKLAERAEVMFRSSNRRSRANFELYCKNTPKSNIPFEKDAYYAAFIKNVSLRESCYRCRFARNERVGDITLSDCGSRDHYPDFHPCESVSAVLVNTERGARLFGSLLKAAKSDARPIDFALEARFNKQLSSPTARPTERNSVYRDLAEMPYDEFSNKYTADVGLVWKLKRIAKLLVPVNVRYRLKRAFKRG